MTVGAVPWQAAVRARALLVLSLFAAAAAGSWAWTAREMRGMDGGSWTALGGFGWFVGVWVVMTAAMMLPSVAPTVALYARMATTRAASWAFVLGYLLTWALAGVAAYGVGVAATGVAGDLLAWDRAGQAAAGTTLLLAAGYELSPLKDVCLGRCRSPLGALLGSWRDGVRGAVRMGARNGAWCVGCCWALMASLFALGVMSISWMAVIAGLIAAEKTLPWRRVATATTTAVLLTLGVLVLVAPEALPWFAVPGEQMSM